MAYKAAVVGAAGYAGIELVRRLVEHPDFELVVITSNADAGCKLADMYPAFTGVSDLEFSRHDCAELIECDVAFMAVPHTAALAQAPRLLEAGVSVVDLSADYRLKDPAIYEKWYETEHTSPELLKTCAFGLPEITRDELDRVAADHAAGKAVLVACAGCYPTATSLAAYPAVSKGWAKGTVNVQAISGVTGAGKKCSNRTHFCHANENVEAYGVGKHRHTPEIEQILGLPDRVLFIPHLAPLNRGLLSTVTIQLTDEAAKDFDLDATLEMYQEFYASSPFVTVLPKGQMPRTDSIAGSNRAQVGLAYHETTHTLIAIGAIDNLCKGAASQAVQCANIVFGLPEDAGLAAMANPV
ncbi:MAG: N-acetyl-gamma-glutamyl-phosphate reductase [Eggerthellaceae bacterium]|nr:N-acetyl-gamma-glutamyl-phosphate reductase [Eggerthellaceae bacterium]